jgi:predicted dehydrogenase
MSTQPSLEDATQDRHRTAAGLAGPLLVVGAGSIGTRHLRNLRDLGVTEMVVHRTGQGRPREAYLPDAVIETDLARALAYRPLAAVVCNPSALHVSTALAAARSGCHLFIEKPVSDSLSGIAELQAEVEKRGLTATVGFQFRFHPALRQIHDWIAGGAIGDVVSVRAHWGEYLPGWHPDEDYRGSYSARRELGGGVVLTLCHPFDYLRWMVGDVVEVTALTAQGSGLELNVEDTAHVLLRFASGALGSVTLDYAERPSSHELHIVGRRGTIRWSDTDGAAVLHDGESARSMIFRPPTGFTRNTMFVDEMRHFIACLKGEQTPACRLEDGVAVLEIALAAKRSAQTGRSVDV